MNAWKKIQDYIELPFCAPTASIGERLKILGFNTLFFAIISFLLLSRNQDHILFTGDLYNIFINNIKQVDKAPLFSQTSNFLVYGNVDFGINPRLMPAFWLGAQVPNSLVVATVYTVISIELFMAVFITVWLFQFSTLAAVVSAWTVCLSILPYYWPYLVWVELSVIIPGLYTASSVLVLFSGVFYQLGKGGVKSSLFCLMILTSLAIYSILALLQYSVVLFFMLMWVCVGIFLVSLAWRESALKALSGAFVIAVFIILDIFQYIQDFYSYNWADLVTGGVDRLQVMIDRIINFRFSFSGFNFHQTFHLSRPAVPASVTQEFAIMVLASSIVLVLLFINRRKSNLFKISAIFLVTIIGYMSWQWGYLEAVIAPLWGIMFAMGLLALYRLSSAVVLTFMSGGIIPTAEPEGEQLK